MHGVVTGAWLKNCLLKINNFMKCYIFLMLAMGKSLKIQVISSYLAEIYFQEKVILRLFKYGI